jgi:RHS repeat-associated protein
LFTGREWLGQAGIYDYRNRVYSAQIGRFLQNDPIQFEAGDVNLYRYVGNGPVNWVDPLGLITIAIPGAGPTGPGWANHDFTQGVQYRHSDTQIFGRHQRAQQRALDAISAARANNPCEVVNIYGYSRGGVGALELAERLNQAGIPVDNLILIDPVTVTGNGGGIVVPSNVSNAESHYQRGPREGFTDFPGTPLNPGPGRSNTQYSGPHANMPRQYFER